MTRVGLPGSRVLVIALLALVLSGPAFAGKKHDDMTNQELYDLAMRRIDKGSHYKARLLLEKLLKRANVEPSLVALAQLGLADAYYGKKGLLNLTEAMSRYSSFLTFYPTHEMAAYAQYRLGLCHLQQVLAADRDQRETHTAIEEFRRVQSVFPDSPYVDLAAEKIQEGSDLLAEHEYRVGVFYYDQKAYLGAIDRFLNILDKFPRYTRKDRLYFHLGVSLLRTERTEEGEIYLLKLMETYPKSRHSTRARTFLPGELEP